MNKFEEHFIKVNDVNLHVLQYGPIDGPLIILLHGFPEFSYAWKKQILFFASMGYRVWAPDQRGYNLSAKPKKVSSYRLDKLAEDIIELINISKKEEVYLVGHDWGGIVSWHIASNYKNRIKKIIVLNAPHGLIMKNYLITNPFQRKRSSYVFYFQIPYLAEIRMKLQKFKGLITLLKRSTKVGSLNKNDLLQYFKAWRIPYAYSSMINWYRANIRKSPLYSDDISISISLLLLWSKQDRYFELQMAQDSIDLCENAQLHFFENSSHWLHHDYADEVNTLIYEFIKKESL